MTIPVGLRNTLLRYSHLVYDKGWVANHDGNLTARVGPGRILATPTAMSKGDIAERDLIVVDEDGKQTSGRRRPFSELALHLAVYAARPDAAAVIHAHPPYATAMSVAGLGIDRPIIAEAVVSLGDRVPLAPYARPKTGPWATSVGELAVYYDAMILQNHGVIALGDDLEQAFLRLELVEHLARILHHSAAFGGPKFLPEKDIEILLEARARAGLGPRARGIDTPAPSGGTSVPGLANRELAKIIAAELKRLTD